MVRIVRKPETPPAADGLADTAARNTLAVHPLIGIRATDFGGAARVLAGSFVQHPLRTARHAQRYAQAVGKVLAGEDPAGLDGADKRFADPAWRSNPFYRRLRAWHGVTAQELSAFVEETPLSTRDRARAQLAASLWVDAAAPSNTLLNPAALRRALDTGGMSLVRGARNLVHDIRHNHGMPSSVNKAGFELGRNLCLSPGRVVFRNEVLELIQYQPTVDKVHARPLVMCPPQVNKFYAVDLSPDKSLVRWIMGQGLQMFVVSWCNPTAAQRDWGLSTYVQALDAAVDAARQITGSPDVNLWGACSGGMTAAAYLGWLAATGQRKVASIVSPVCVLDPAQASDSTLGLLLGQPGVEGLAGVARRKGVVEGSELARVFAWLRPNDLVWNYWVNNYLLGNDPPAFDILYWNADTTRLPAALHADLVGLFRDAPFARAGVLEVLGEKINLRKVKVSAYFVAGTTDHITPWQACFDSARLYGPDSQFVLTNAGHVQSMLCPPGAPKAQFQAAPVGRGSAQDWLATAARRDGSWWPHWMDWMRRRSGPLVDAPRRLGSRKHRPAEAAPGTYVHAS